MNTALDIAPARAASAATGGVKTYANAFQLPVRPSLLPIRVTLTALLICGLLLINKLGTPGSLVFFGVLLVMIIKSPEAAFLAFMIGALGLMTNASLVPKTSVWTIGRLAILFVCFLRFSVDLSATRKSLFEKSYYWALLLFIASAATCSLISGYYVHIALLKLLSFSVGLSAVLAGVYVLHLRRADMAPWFVALAGTIVLNGFLALILGVGYGRSIMGDLYSDSLYFQGPFFHPNACGPFCGLLIVLLFSTWLFSDHRSRSICLLLILPLLYFMWLSKSRTGVASLVVGIVAVIVLTFLPTAGRFVRLRLNMSRVGLLITASLITMFVVLVDVGSQGLISRSLFTLVNKYDKTAESYDSASILSSRQQLIERGWQGFLDRPLTGLGFEVSLDPYFVENATLFSAPIEKGFLPTAVLEEVGLLGTVPFLLFLITMIVSLWRKRNAPGLAMLITYLTSNLGEVSIFALGGPGLLGWLLVAAGMLVGDHCVTASSPRPAVMPRAA